MDSQFDKLLKETDPCQLLGCPRGASDEQINKAYKKMSLKWHPDKWPTVDETTKEKIKGIFQNIASAREQLLENFTSSVREAEQAKQQSDISKMNERHAKMKEELKSFKQNSRKEIKLNRPANIFQGSTPPKGGTLDGNKRNTFANGFEKFKNSKRL